MSLRKFARALSAKYYMEYNYARSLALLAFQVDQGSLKISEADFFDDQPPFELPSVEFEDGKRVAVHSIQGPIMRDDQFCGPKGTVTMSQEFQMADENEDVIAHILHMHTRGGEVEGLEEFSRVISNAEKPVVAYGEMMHSAGYHIASSADYIVLSGENAAVGSVGVQVSYLDFSEAFKKAGIRPITIKASTSPDKNKYNFDNPTEEDKELFAKEELDPLDTNFMAHVQKNRPQIDESALTGNTYYAQEALQLGMVDYIGTFEQAVELALDMSGIQPAQNSNINMTTDQNPVADSSAVDPAASMADFNAEMKSQFAQVFQKLEAMQKELSAYEALENRIVELEKAPSEPESALENPAVTQSNDIKDEAAAPKEVLQIIQFHAKRHKTE